VRLVPIHFRLSKAWSSKRKIVPLLNQARILEGVNFMEKQLHALIIQVLCGGRVRSGLYFSVALRMMINCRYLLEKRLGGTHCQSGY